jgi:hypothetical protein
MTYDNTNRGILGRNDRKEPGSSAPDFTGNLNVGGVEYWLDAWTTQRKDGSGSFFSVKVKPKDAPKSAPARQQASGPNDADDFPFVSSSVHFDMDTGPARRMARYGFRRKEFA